MLKFYNHIVGEVTVIDTTKASGHEVVASSGMTTLSHTDPVLHVAWHAQYDSARRITYNVSRLHSHYTSLRVQIVSGSTDGCVKLWGYKKGNPALENQTSFTLTMADIPHSRRKTEIGGMPLYMPQLHSHTRPDSDKHIIFQV